MEPPTKKDKDVNCRLRHGLNANCLERIFQYLNSVDLYRVGEMNLFYNQIIEDLVIPKHTVNFEPLLNLNIAEPFFEKYGKKIENIEYSDDNKPEFQQIIRLNHLNQLITQHCSIDQLKDISIFLGWGINSEHTDSPEYLNQESIIDFQSNLKRIKKFIFSAYPSNTMRLTVKLTESLRYLQMKDVNLDPNFDWTQLANLTELHLVCVRGIIADNFIELLRQRPKLEVFLHRNSFEDSTVQNIFDMLGTYCGEKIRIFKNYDNVCEKRHFYNFISKFKCVKEVYLNTTHVSCADLLDPIKRLAENNTTECLAITYDNRHRHKEICIFRAQSNHEVFDMKYFTNLKKVRIFFALGHINLFNQCDALQLFNLYSLQILSNVEILEFFFTNIHKCNFIQYMPKLRKLILTYCNHTSDEAAKILSMVRINLNKRNTEHTNSDFIEIIVEDKMALEKFSVHDGIDSSIKLSVCGRL